MSSSFPEGTLCHQAEDGSNYYCQDRLCLPENLEAVEPNTRLLEQGEFKDTDQLLLSEEGFIISKIEDDLTKEEGFIEI